ncbi:MULTISPECIES: DUF1361 domain-containing protein [unclassified Spirosoma]|uniref:DUF1361 domain-containing protein n=1 Tax=unclassified Spirosoma TaxID=2621999 RepID=UPI000967F100|nr:MULTISPECIES: DUF1361 domain-containing protein [unclassified Spirosoma]MBN8823581.1 DUF1361 domain-containing protein [Spirosoma sp.]OJW76859.1 MAG: hypothetical protein BGO59_21760 [Spirosoma sp. 48-14]
MQTLYSPSYRSGFWEHRDARSGKGLRILALLSATGLSLVVARGLLTGNWWFFICLTWNLALAWFPLGTILTLRDLRTAGFRSPWLMLSGLMLWLAFLPNAPYIITDLFHLKYIDHPLLWFDTMSIFIFALTGLLTGLYSILIVHRMVKPLLGNVYTWAVITTSQLLSGFGIYLGRFGRWNSWDVLARPTSLTRAIAHAYHDHLSVQLTLAYGFVLIALYIAFYWYAAHDDHS